MPDESNETPELTEIDVHNNRESRSAASEAITRIARASDGGAPPRRGPESGELPESLEGGTAAGNPVAGMTISEEDAKDAVKGRTSG